jgi:hypothetical protein
LFDSDWGIPESSSYFTDFCLSPSTTFFQFLFSQNQRNRVFLRFYTVTNSCRKNPVSAIGFFAFLHCHQFLSQNPVSAIGFFCVSTLSPILVAKTRFLPTHRKEIKDWGLNLKLFIDSGVKHLGDNLC